MKKGGEQRGRGDEGERERRCERKEGGGRRKGERWEKAW